MSKLSFSFNPQKLIQAIVFFSKKGVSDLTKMKIAKLLFFADKTHLMRHGRPIIGDEYYAMEWGPVPSAAKNLIDAAEELMVSSGTGETAKLFDGYLEMAPTPTYPVARATGPENYRVFSKSDLKVLEEVVEQYGHMTAAALSALAHKDRAYAIPDKERPQYGRARMPYELFFDRSDDPMQRVAEAEQEHRDLVASLR
ncbi:MAG TPA: Panacea domain-containing protein [Thermoanaerobaculia bacterium]|nr:Panacea domain-containing protein [Thermoanaerobaculia bacterium]